MHFPLAGESRMCCSNRFPFFIAVLGLTSWAAFGLYSGRLSNADETKATQQASQKSETNKVQDKRLRHVVLFQFKETSSPADIKKVVDAFRELPQKIKVIADFEWGTNNSPEGLSDGLTHGFIITFSSEKDRDIYLKHPDHQAFVDVLKPHLQKPLVIDFWATK
jgi:Stress responsive A/B Barrel Domain